MSSRAIKQPNGLYARFSTIVDNFTHYNHTREALWIIFQDEAGVECADGKMLHADENPGRFEEAIEVIKVIHGVDVAESIRGRISKLGFGSCPDCVWYGQPEGCNAERDSILCWKNKIPRLH